jgi:UDP-N-acetylglucosamine 2-epimerase (non-hydrolysing)
MKKIKILSVIGTRPEAVKMAPVVQALSQNPYFKSLVCVTAQHREMLDQILSLFDIQPDIDLNLMEPNQNLPALSSRILEEMESVIQLHRPDWVLVQGDTTTTMMTALAAFYSKTNIGHVEAGLRTSNKYAPFPEEVNRRVTSVIADLHFAPTAWSKNNLLQENIPSGKILVTGNTVVDALNAIKDQPLSEDVKTLIHSLGVENAKKKLILVTAHRRENIGEGITNICLALKEIALRAGDFVELVFPVHLNPNVRSIVFGLLSGTPHITLIDPLPYLSLVHMLQQAYLVLTDSGGIQEEAASLNKPTLVLREVTERPEGIEAGILKLVGTDKEKIVNSTMELLTDEQKYLATKTVRNIYGDGNASQRILDAIHSTSIYLNQ